MTKENTIKLFNEKHIRTQWDDDQELWYFSIVDVVAVLTDQNDYVEVGNYQGKQEYRLRLTFDLDKGTYTVLLDDTLLVEDWPHGVTNGRGIGSIYTGFRPNPALTNDFMIDDLQVGASFILDDIIFKDNFE